MHRLTLVVFTIGLVAAACGGGTSTSNTAANSPTSTVETTSAEATTSSTARSEAATTSTNESAPETTLAEPATETTATQPTETTPEPVGDANQRLVGEFETLLTGTTIDLADFHNQDVVLWMWAPW